MRGIDGNVPNYSAEAGVLCRIMEGIIGELATAAGLDYQGYLQLLDKDPGELAFKLQGGA